MDTAALFEQLRLHLVQQASFDRSALAAASSEPSLAALAALDEEGVLREAVLKLLPADWDKLDDLQLLAVVQSENEAREGQIDDALAAKKHRARACGALARVGGLWSHDGLMKALEDAEVASAAACVVAESEPEALDEWLEQDAEEVDPRALLEVLRARVLRGGSDDAELLDELADSLREEDSKSAQRFISRMESLIAIASPGYFARGYLRGTFESSWWQDSAAVADFLSMYGEPTWLETLAMLEVGECAGAFEFASMIAVSASAGLLEADQQQGSDLLTLLQDARDPKGSWEPTAIRHGFQLAIAMGDEDLAPLLVEAAVHDRLCWNDLPSIGIQGLPLSSNDDASLDIDAAIELFTDALAQEQPDDDVVVSIVRTLCDLRRLHQEEVGAVDALIGDPENVFPRLCDHPNAAINLAARRLITQIRPVSPLETPPPASARDAIIAGLDVPGSPQLLAALAAGDTVASLWAAAELTELPLEDAFPVLAGAWASCAPIRGVYLRALIRELLEEDMFVYA